MSDNKSKFAKAMKELLNTLDELSGCEADRELIAKTNEVLDDAIELSQKRFNHGDEAWTVLWTDYGDLMSYYVAKFTVRVDGNDYCFQSGIVVNPDNIFDCKHDALMSLADRISERISVLKIRLGQIKEEAEQYR